jgi:pimeloyl-ACP methyl ester carboxylesterase
VELVTADHVRLPATRWVAHGPARGTVVLVHGFGACADEARVVTLAEALRDHGVDVLAYDARGHGASGGATTLGDDEHLDVAAAVDTIEPSGRPVVLVAASMGAIAALRYAASHPSAVAGVVAVSCPARWRLPRNARGVASALLTHTAFGRGMARRHMGVRIAPHAARSAPPVDVVATMATPVAFVHGRDDPFIAPDDATLLHAAAHDPRRLDLVDGLGHAFEAAAIEPVLASLDWCLAQAERRPPAESAGAV